MNDALEDLRAENDALRNEVVALRQEIEALRAQNETGAKLMAQSAACAAQLAKEIKRLRMGANYWEAQCGTLNTKLNEL